MNNKDFISQLALRTDMSDRETQNLVSAFIAQLSENLNEECSLAVQGFGNFEVRKKLERVVTNPSTRQRMLIPPKLVLAYRPSATLKDKLK